MTAGAISSQPIKQLSARPAPPKATPTTTSFPLEHSRATSKMPLFKLLNLWNVDVIHSFFA